ncbi:Dopamine receptor 3 [Caenorhabditis elegans]|uniref:Dopamine receptor 3 n=1 Tax=Caenorhabditis elegans TaxID=6239 RepID=DOPR3_CAEEL|nr:Dopamine receptor 3 [Caenorhabditis elegans]Q6RYS9.1 RecName: Full=Dopamine receptor 3; AltName: Full=Dopamine D2-like receptor dop-3 [Caenorhabditis elegans]AAR37416.1 DOP-3 [Caenorhabditis elegans]CCD83405.1 Dopamine receptor 3 [Caenorhabditis elegans]|eukprot:NP_001024908.2 Dopamine receptor 3 [Caenorhabditis elegans]
MLAGQHHVTDIESPLMVVLWRVAAGVFLPLVPTMAVFGNVLVIMSVFRERSLQTVTNMLIVSLAVSDFMVAIGVMSFGVYYEWNDFKWGLGSFFCHVYQALDVACSTASILNLLAISLDRYIAIGHPISYAQYGARGGRAMISITIVWGVSVAVALPLLLGVNPMEENDLQECELANPYFNMISSIFSFFIPCIAMIILYTIIFRRLRQRERARSLRQAQRSENDKISSALLGGAQIARQMGKHFKNRTDQILLEISFQTSSFPTMSESSEDASTISPMINSFNNFLPKKTPYPSTSIPAIPECGSMPNLTIIERPEAEKEKEISIMDLRDTVEMLDDKYSSAILTSFQTSRSFGEELEEILPFIDGSNSVKHSREQLHTTRSNTSTTRLLDVKPELRSISVPSIQDEKKLSQKSNDLPFSHQNGTHKQKLLPNPGILMKSKSTTLLKTNGYMDTDSLNRNSHKKSLADLLANDEFSFSDSMRVYKNRLFKSLSRATSGWNKPRPSRHMVKKATKQMRREHKATVTLAVVLAVFLFCWLPFFVLHLSNSICLIIDENSACVGFLPLYLATWLGYLNSSLNPLIYTVFDQRFRNAFRNILSCGIFKKR